MGGIAYPPILKVESPNLTVPVCKNHLTGLLHVPPDAAALFASLRSGHHPCSRLESDCRVRSRVRCGSRRWCSPLRLSLSLLLSPNSPSRNPCSSPLTGYALRSIRYLCLPIRSRHGVYCPTARKKPTVVPLLALPRRSALQKEFPLRRRQGEALGCLFWLLWRRNLCVLRRTVASICRINHGLNHPVTHASVLELNELFGR